MFGLSVNPGAAGVFGANKCTERRLIFAVISCNPLRAHLLRVLSMVGVGIITSSIEAKGDDRDT